MVLLDDELHPPVFGAPFLGVVVRHGLAAPVAFDGHSIIWDIVFVLEIFLHTQSPLF